MLANPPRSASATSIPRRPTFLKSPPGSPPGGSAGAEPGIFEVVGGDGPVEGFNAHTGVSLGTEVFWTSRGPNDGGNPPYAVESWMIWNAVAPTAEGRIDVLLSTTAQSLSRVSLNAARLMESPQAVDEPGPAPGTLAAWITGFAGLTEADRDPLANPARDGLPQPSQVCPRSRPHDGRKRS